MSTRRESREWALQILFQLDLNPSVKLDEVFSEFWKSRKAGKKARSYSEGLVLGVRQHINDLDTLLKEYADNWDIGRMGVVDRNVLRLSLYEMQYCDDVPAVVAINEAVDIVKYFSCTESGKFVNGILDRVRKTHLKK